MLKRAAKFKAKSAVRPPYNDNVSGSYETVYGIYNMSGKPTDLTIQDLTIAIERSDIGSEMRADLVLELRNHELKALTEQYGESIISPDCKVEGLSLHQNSKESFKISQRPPEGRVASGHVRTKFECPDRIGVEHQDFLLHMLEVPKELSRQLTEDLIYRVKNRCLVSSSAREALPILKLLLQLRPTYHSTGITQCTGDTAELPFIVNLLRERFIGLTPGTSRISSTNLVLLSALVHCVFHSCYPGLEVVVLVGLDQTSLTWVCTILTLHTVSTPLHCFVIQQQRSHFGVW